MVTYDPFDAVRDEADPLVRAQLAGDLISVYRQRGHDLARIRRDAINQVVEQRGVTFSAVGADLGLTRGRISQIRKDAPATERAFFGVGPIDIATPTRKSDDRPSGVVALEDAEAARIMTDLLRSLAFETRPVTIPLDGKWSPMHEAVVICGPKSSDASAAMLAGDPNLNFHEVDGRWVIEDRASGHCFTSPMDDGTDDEDVAYIGRITHERRTMLLIAGVHALGSVGAAAHLQANLPSIHAQVGYEDFSMVVRSSFQELSPNMTEEVWGPTPHR